MKKDAYYFPHFCNARHDRKLKRVQKELGIEGYGIYFMIIEVLREQDGFKYPMEDIDLLADEFGTSEQKVNTVVCNYKLFKIDNNNNFFSIKMKEYLKPYLDRSKRARDAAKARWDNNAKAYANALPEQSGGNASKVKKKESKVKKKVNNNNADKKFKKPTLEDVQKYCFENNYCVDPEKFIDYYTSNGWKVGKNSMKCWKSAVRTWGKNNYNQSSQQDNFAFLRR